MIERHCKAKHPNPADFVGECHFCRLAVTNPSYRAWASPAASAAAAAACPHRGGPTGERHECPTCSGRVSIPVLSCAVHGACTFARKVEGVACCDGCKDDPTKAAAQAAGYKPRPPADPFASPVVVPPPPAFTPRTAARRALVTVVAGDKGRALWALSGPSFRAYAERVGAELVVSGWEGNRSWPMSAKFGIGPILAAFDEWVFADADVLFQPGSVDLFSLRESPAEVLAFNDLPHVLRHAPEFAVEYQRVRESQGMPRAPMPWYLNTGFVVGSRRHAAHVAPPPGPIPPLHCAEQHLWNARIYDFGCPVRFMTDDQHYQWWIRGTMRGAPPWAVLHFSGMNDEPRRLSEMAAAAGRW